MYQSGQDLLDEIIEVLDYAHRYDSYISSRCPFHDDTRPSFFVYSDYYTCLACGAHGRTENLLSRLGKGTLGSILAPVKSATFHNPFTRWEKKFSSIEKALFAAYKNGPSVYMEHRGIDKRTQKALKIGMLEDWITFPIFDENGWFVGAVARAGEENTSEAKYVCPAGQDPNLLYVPSWKNVAKSDKLYLVFGIIDAVTLYMKNLPSASTVSGQRLQPTALESIRKRIIFIPDVGEDNSARKIASKLGWRGSVMKVNYPSGSKDVNDVYRNNQWGVLQFA